MSVEIVSFGLEDKKNIKKFINFLWDVNKDEPNWVPQLKLTLKENLSPKHPFYATAEVKLFLAYKNGKIAGRIMAIYNRHYNKFHEANIGHFGLFDFHNDQEVSSSLFIAAKEYLTQFNVSALQGPVNPSTNYESGLLIEGHDTKPYLMMPHNAQYYTEHFEKLGLVKAKDLFAYIINLNFDMPEKIRKICEKMETSNHISWRFLDKKNFDRDIDLIRDIYNDAWEKNWGFVPMTDDEFKLMAKELKQIVDPELVIFVFVGDKPAGFAVALPDVNQVFDKIPNGKLLPFGILKLLNMKKYIHQLRVPILGVKKEYHHMGLASILYQKLYDKAREKKYTDVEMSWILEDNLPMNKPLLLMGGKVYKTYRIFEQQL